MSEPKESERPSPVVGDDGWHTSELPGGAAIHARVANRDGRVVITDLYVHGTEIDSVVLRSINTTKIRALAEGRGPIDAAGVASPEPSLADLRRRVRGGRMRRASLSRQIPPLTRPTGNDPDGFYSRVADAYRHYARTQGRAAAAAIASEAAVPVTTAHRWVREARRRGFLPPGERGKTG